MNGQDPSDYTKELLDLSMKAEQESFSQPSEESMALLGLRSNPPPVERVQADPTRVVQEEPEVLRARRIEQERADALVEKAEKGGALRDIVTSGQIANIRSDMWQRLADKLLTSSDPANDPYLHDEYRSFKETKAKLDKAQASIEGLVPEGIPILSKMGNAPQQLAAMLPDQWKSIVGSWANAMGGAAAGVGASFAIGAIPPLTAIPDEVITAPAGAILGARAGLSWGATKYWYKQGLAEQFDNLVSEGVRHEDASRIAKGAAVPYALVETLSSLTGLELNPVGMAVNATIRKSITSVAKKQAAKSILGYITRVAGEVGEEGLQSTVYDFAESVAKDVSDKAEVETDIEKKTMLEIAANGIRASYDSLFPIMLGMGIMPGNGIIHDSKKSQHLRSVTERYEVPDVELQMSLDRKTDNVAESQVAEDGTTKLVNKKVSYHEYVAYDSTGKEIGKGKSAGEALNQVRKARGMEEKQEAKDVEVEVQSSDGTKSKIKIDAGTNDALIANETGEVPQLRRTEALQADTSKAAEPRPAGMKKGERTFGQKFRDAFGYDASTVNTGEGIRVIDNLDDPSAQIPSNEVRNLGKMIRFLGETLYGKPVIFVASDKKTLGAYGFYSGEAIYIDIQHPGVGLLEVLNHEGGHAVWSWTRKAGNEKQKQIIDDAYALAKKSFPEQEIIEIFENKEEAVSSTEFSARALSNLLSKEAQMLKLIQAQPDMASKLLSVTRDFFRSIGSQFYKPIFAGVGNKILRPAEVNRPLDPNTDHRVSYSNEAMRSMWGEAHDETSKRVISAATDYVRSVAQERGVDLDQTKARARAELWLAKESSATPGLMIARFTRNGKPVEFTFPKDREEEWNKLVHDNVSKTDDEMVSALEDKFGAAKEVATPPLKVKHDLEELSAKQTKSMVLEVEQEPAKEGEAAKPFSKAPLGIGKKVKYQGKDAFVLRHLFGKVQIRAADGQILKVDKSELKIPRQKKAAEGEGEAAKRDWKFEADKVHTSLRSIVAKGPAPSSSFILADGTNTDNGGKSHWDTLVEHGWNGESVDQFLTLTGAIRAGSFQNERYLQFNAEPTESQREGVRRYMREVEDDNRGGYFEGFPWLIQYYDGWGSGRSFNAKGYEDFAQKWPARDALYRSPMASFMGEGEAAKRLTPIEEMPLREKYSELEQKISDAKMNGHLPRYKQPFNIVPMARPDPKLWSRMTDAQREDFEEKYSRANEQIDGLVTAMLEYYRDGTRSYLDSLRDTNRPKYDFILNAMNNLAIGREPFGQWLPASFRWEERDRYAIALREKANQEIAKLSPPKLTPEKPTPQVVEKATESGPLGIKNNPRFRRNVGEDLPPVIVIHPDGQTLHGLYMGEDDGYVYLVNHEYINRDSSDRAAPMSDKNRVDLYSKPVIVKKRSGDDGTVTYVQENREGVVFLVAKNPTKNGLYDYVALRSPVQFRHGHGMSWSGILDPERSSVQRGRPKGKRAMFSPDRWTLSPSEPEPILSIPRESKTWFAAWAAERIAGKQIAELMLADYSTVDERGRRHTINRQRARDYFVQNYAKMAERLVAAIQTMAIFSNADAVKKRLDDGSGSIHAGREWLDVEKFDNEDDAAKIKLAKRIFVSELSRREEVLAGEAVKDWERQNYAESNLRKKQSADPNFEQTSSVYDVEGEREMVGRSDPEFAQFFRMAVEGHISIPSGENYDAAVALQEKKMADEMLAQMKKSEKRTRVEKPKDTPDKRSIAQRKIEEIRAEREERAKTAEQRAREDAIEKKAMTAVGMEVVKRIYSMEGEKGDRLRSIWNQETEGEEKLMPTWIRSGIMASATGGKAIEDPDVKEVLDGVKAIFYSNVTNLKERGAKPAAIAAAERIAESNYRGYEGDVAEVLDLVVAAANAGQEKSKKEQDFFAEEGEGEAAKRLIDDAETGSPISVKLFRGDPDGVVPLAKRGTYEPASLAWYFIAQKDQAIIFGKNISRHTVNLNNPLVVDAGSKRHEIGDTIKRAVKNGNDGVIVKNMKDGRALGDVVAVFNRSSISESSDILGPDVAESAIRDTVEMLGIVSDSAAAVSREGEGEAAKSYRSQWDDAKFEPSNWVSITNMQLMNLFSRKGDPSSAFFQDGLTSLRSASIDDVSDALRAIGSRTADFHQFSFAAKELRDQLSYWNRLYPGSLTDSQQDLLQKSTEYIKVAASQTGQELGGARQRRAEIMAEAMGRMKDVNDAWKMLYRLGTEEQKRELLASEPEAARRLAIFADHIEDMVFRLFNNHLKSTITDEKLRHVEAQNMANALFKKMGKPSITTLTPRYVSGILREVGPLTSDFMDKSVEWFKMGLLSGIATMTQNPVTSVLRLSYEHLLKNPIDLMINLVQGTAPKETMAAQYRNSIALFKPFVIRAMAIAGESFAAQLPLVRFGMFGEEYLEKGVGKAAISNRWSIPLGKGRSIGFGDLVRFPGRINMTSDQFFTALDMQLLAAQNFIRDELAKGNKPTVKEIGDHVEQVLNSGPENQHFVKAYDKAMEHAYMNKNPYVAPIVGLKNEYRILDFLFPFLNTQTNFFTQGMRLSPLGSVRLAWNTGKAAARGKAALSNYIHSNQFSGDVSEQALAWGMTMILAAMIHPPPDDDPEKMKWLPTFTGAQPYFRTNPGDLRVSQELAMPAMSIRIGNQFWDYSRLEPFASILPWIHEIIHVGSSGRNGVPTREALRDSMSVLGQAVSDKNFTGAMGDLIQATMDPDNAERYAANMFASFAMPNIVRSVIRAKDKEVLSAAPKGERGTMERLASLAGNTAYSMTGASAFKPAPKVDYFGRTVTKTGPGATPLTDFLYRLFKITMPSSAKVGDSFKYTRMIYAWNGTERYRWMKEYPNATKVTSELGLTQPQSFLSFKAGGYDQKHYLSSEEYEQYSRLIGQIFLGKLDHVRFNYDKPTPRDIAVFRKLHDDSTEQAGRIMKNMLKKDGVIP